MAVCPPHKDVAPHHEIWEILSIEGMIFVAIIVFAVFVVLFGSCQIWHYLHKRDVLSLRSPVSAKECMGVRERERVREWGCVSERRLLVTMYNGQDVPSLLQP